MKGQQGNSGSLPLGLAAADMLDCCAILCAASKLSRDRDPTDLYRDASGHTTYKSELVLSPLSYGVGWVPKP